ncbi:MAG: hypothetical protein ACI9MB_002251, partial [Verrucomicrobiales bacterium]
SGFYRHVWLTKTYQDCPQSLLEIDRLCGG